MRLQSVSKRYGLRQPWIVRGVTLGVQGGRLIRLEGRNGSGKSTLLRVAAGVLLPSAGRVTGRPHTGYVPERFPGGLPFSAREYLVHLGRVHGLRGASAGRRADEWLERLGAADHAGASMRSLSKGMCQKVAIAQALLPHPGLLVLDEAWTGLDQTARGALDAAVAERVADGGAVMFVDHDPARLAGQVSERWQLDGSGQVRVVPGGVPAPAAAPGAVTVVEVSGLDDESVTRLAGLPGVLSVSAGGPGRSGAAMPGPAGSGGPERGTPERVTSVRIAAGESDRVLRQLLAWDRVHVAAVRHEPGASR